MGRTDTVNRPAAAWLCAGILSLALAACNMPWSEVDLSGDSIPSRPTTSRALEDILGMPRPSNPTASSAPNVPLVSGVLYDECLLTAEQFATLTGRETHKAEMGPPSSNDAAARSCFYTAQAGQTAIGRIDVFGTRGLSPEEVVTKAIAKGNHKIENVGKAAALLRGTFPTVNNEMYFASGDYLVLIRVNEAEVPDDRWQAAGGQAIGKLPTAVTSTPTPTN
ncbi:DUF3558 domain-containing protein [Pseudonocardiaceae bacterium YIM PH 21723]|nr:DUF3558 domain-containing protein [Pseudonocardiaceae bacterium YIM PH 21723]